MVRPNSEAQIQELLAFCNREGIGLTSCGSQTSLTGASVSHGQLLMSLENMPKDWRIYEDPDKPGRWLAEAGPGIILSEFQDQLAEKGFFYPPDPTSRREVQLGATVATNASGEDTYRYGSTRRWVRGLRYVRADGTVAEAKRPVEARGDGKKNTCGYPFLDSEIDLLIGSEGTLGVITRITVEVLKGVPEFFSVLFFLPSETHALEQVIHLHQNPDFELRCLEYLDEGAVSILRQKGIPVPKGAAAALYVKEEFEGDDEAATMRWYDYLEAMYGRWDLETFLNDVHFAGDRSSQLQLREWRHAVPSTINERAARNRKNGGGKVGTDWYVPLPKLISMFNQVREDQGDMEWVVFGHIGNGHPHFNFIAKNEREYLRARDLLVKHCALAVKMGGGVSGEHGLGKLKNHLLSLQYSTDQIEAMKAAKKRMDPNGILGQGNIFAD